MNFFGDIDLKGNKLINVGPTNATIESGLGSGGSDPLLEARVEKLENQAASILYSFDDRFDNESLIDWGASSNVTRVTSGGETYVAIQTSTVTSNSNLQSDADGANSSSIEYSSGAVRNVASTQGVYTSNYYTINAATQAQINAQYTAPNVNGFSDETLFTTTNLNSSIINFFTISDATTRWFFYQTIAGYGEVYGWAINITNGTTVMAHRRIGGAGPVGNITPSIYRSLSAKLDNNGNVWLACWRYTGGTAASNNRCAVYKILKNSPASDAFTDESRAIVAAATIGSVDTFYDSATDRFHALYSLTLGSNMGLVIFNGSPNGFLLQNTINNGTTTSLIYNVKLVKSSDASKEVAIFAGQNTSNANGAIRGHRYTIDTSLTYGNITQTNLNFTTTGACSGLFDVAFDSANNNFVGINVRNGGASLDLFKIPASGWIVTSYSVFNNSALSPAATVGTISSGVSDGSHFYLSYMANDGFYNRIYSTKMLISNGSTSSANNGFLHQKIISTNTIAQFDIDQPIMENRSGTVSLFYDKNTGNTSNLVGSVRFGSFAPKLKIEAQMLNGIGWVEVFNNDTGVNSLTQPVTLANTKQTQIRFRATMTSPNGSTQQATVSQFTATVPGSNSTGVLVSKSLVTGKPITKVTLSPDVTLGNGINGIDGTVTFQATNNGGAPSPTWVNVTSGTDFLFNSIGTDLRIRATITIPPSSTGTSPRIQGYGGTAGNIAQQSDLVILNVNLMKTTLQLNTLLTAQRLSWTNMMVDTFSDSSGVTLGAGLSLSAGTITGTGTVTSAIETAEINPVNSIVVVAESTGGAVTYQVSRDGGLTFPYTATPNTITVLDGNETTRNQICIRANLTGGASLAGWAYLYA